MGDVIYLSERRADRSRRAGSWRAAFFFDVACPFSYLAAERIERALGDVEWVPTASAPFHYASSAREIANMRGSAEARAAALRLPLVWPDRFPAGCQSALRAAAYAAESGAGARFALAATRLAFCGGFDLEDPEILAEAAAAAGIGLDECLEAGRDAARDEALLATSRGLLTRGIHRLPAIRVGRRWFDGEQSLGEAASVVRAWSVYGRPLAPVG